MDRRGKSSRRDSSRVRRRVAMQARRRGAVLVLPHLLSLLVLLLPLLVTPFRVPIPSSSSSSSCRPSSSSPSLLRTYSLADKEETTTSSSSSTQQKRQELEALTVYELRSACKQRGLAVAARSKRSDLVDLLLGGGASSSLSPSSSSSLPPSSPSSPLYASMTLLALRETAKGKGLKPGSRSKAELIELLVVSEIAASVPASASSPPPLPPPPLRHSPPSPPPSRPQERQQQQEQQQQQPPQFQQRPRDQLPFIVGKRGGTPSQPNASTVRRRKGLPRMHTLVTEELRENFGLIVPVAPSDSLEEDEEEGKEEGVILEGLPPSTPPLSLSLSPEETTFVVEKGEQATLPPPSSIGGMPSYSMGNSTGCDLELCFLGTASCVPSVSRSVSCIALRASGSTWLFDAGEGSQVQVQRSQIRPSRINKIFVTHAHGDHSFGLPGMLCLMGMEKEQYDNAPVEIYGPEGLRMFLRTIIRYTLSRIVPKYRVHEICGIPSYHKKRGQPAPMVSDAAMPLDTRFNEVEGGKDLYPNEKGVWTLVEEGEMKVQAAPMVHTVPCVGFVITEKDKPGRLRAEYVRPIVERNKEGLLQQGLSDPNKIFRLLKTLKAGEAVNLPDGTLLRAEDVMEGPKQGRKIVICGDTSDASGIAELARDCDVLVHEATNAFLLPFDKGTYMDVERFARAHGHSTPQMAGHFAQRVGAKRLVMTHFSPRYKGDLSPESLAIMKRLEDMARKTSKLKADQVLAAHDLMLVPVPSPHKMAEVGLS